MICGNTLFQIKKSNIYEGSMSDIKEEKKVACSMTTQQFKIHLQKVSVGLKCLHMLQ